MSNELNEPYNTTIIPRQNSQNEILNTRRDHVRLKGDSGASSYFTREEYQHCLDKLVNAAGPMSTILDVLMVHHKQTRMVFYRYQVFYHQHQKYPQLYQV